MILSSIMRLNAKVKLKFCPALTGGGMNIPRAMRFPVFSGDNYAFIPLPSFINIRRQHQPTCPVQTRCDEATPGPSSSNAGHSNIGPFNAGPSNTGPSDTGPSDTGPSSTLQRREYGGKVRMGFIPEEYFKFFHIKTGVSGGYLLMLTLGNYLVSKEIFVMEHEYYTGLSIVTILYFVSTRFGPKVGKVLDKEVDAFIEDWEKSRKDEKAMHETTIKEATLAQERANGQRFLMDAKKENIAMQLEAIYRERLMQVYGMVKGRLDYHLRRYQVEARIQQRWMYQWIMKNVMEAINEDFEKQALTQAIQEIEKIASRA